MVLAKKADKYTNGIEQRSQEEILTYMAIRSSARVPRPHNRKKILPSTNGARKTGYSYETKKKMDPYLTPYIKTESKWIKEGCLGGSVS